RMRRACGGVASVAPTLSLRCTTYDLRSGTYDLKGLQQVDLHVHLAGVMAVLRLFVFLDAGRPDEGLVERLQLGALERIRLMVDAGAIEIVMLVGGVQQIALDEEELERIDD